MVHRNAFAGPGAERNLERCAKKALCSRRARTRLDWAGLGAKIGRHLRRTRRSLWKRRFVRALCRGTGRLRRASADREHLGGQMPRAFCPTGSQRRSSEPSTGWFALPVCSPLRGASRISDGGQPYTARPPLSLRDISPTLWGNLPAPPQSLRSRFGRRLVCAPLAHGAL